MMPSRRSLAATSAALGLLLTIGAGAVLAESHLPDETDSGSSGAEPTRIMVIDPDEYTTLIGGSRVFSASICQSDGTGCRDARNARWTKKPKNGIKLSNNKGTQTKVTANKKGEYSLQAKQGKLVAVITITVNAPAQQQEQSTTSDLRFYLDPSEFILQTGQIFTVNGWQCPLGTAGRLGTDDKPGTADDECLRADLAEVNLDTDSPIDDLGIWGNTFLGEVLRYPGEPGGGPIFTGIQVVPVGGGGTVASASVDSTPFAGPKLGDVDGDGDVDRADGGIIWDTLFANDDEPIGPDSSHWDPRMDLNGDLVIDGHDRQMHGPLAVRDGNLPYDAWTAPLPESTSDTSAEPADLLTAADLDSLIDEIEGDPGSAERMAQAAQGVDDTSLGSGDADGNGSVNLGDVALVFDLARQGAYIKGADTDSDGDVDTIDAVKLMNDLLGGGPPPEGAGSD